MTSSGGFRESLVHRLPCSEPAHRQKVLQVNIQEKFIAVMPPAKSKQMPEEALEEVLSNTFSTLLKATKHAVSHMLYFITTLIKTFIDGINARRLQRGAEEAYCEI